VESNDDWADLDPANWCVLFDGPPRDLDHRIRQIDNAPGELPGRVLRGTRMRDEQGVVSEFAAALQFPHYFGANWDALNDCVTDLLWMGEPGVVLGITDASQLLADEPRRLDTLVEILVDAREYWRYPVVKNCLRDTPQPFTLILQDAPKNLKSLLNRSDTLQAVVAGRHPRPVIWG
jgi:RNAse (barnase) inhibitor barstar